MLDRQEPIPHSGPERIEFACHEIWGGNRSVAAPIELPGIRGALYSRSCDGHRGGDIYYLSVCGSGLLSRFCVADVTGHGEAVASVGSAVHAQMRKFMNRFDQRRILTRLNRRLIEDEFEGMATAVTCTYFPPTRMLSLSAAGHEPAWWYRSQTQQWERLTISDTGRLSNVALGVDPRVRYTRRRIRVRHGDKLVIVTDGAHEARNSSGELFGIDRLDHCLNQHRQLDCPKLVQVIVQRLDEHGAPDWREQDDVTLLALEFVDNLGVNPWLHAIRNRLGIAPAPPVSTTN
ncbi:MAG: serine/threonine-protein phosphatase [Phycisphaerales bacterium]|nr:serine/threonine-protein phosphatase [Phycisphaerales bacterium]MCB9858568.1 serine/threonine-protein phosphatase [Phycisphaerales bacterium]